MKWIGQNIWDQVSKFRNDVHILGANNLYLNGSLYSVGDGAGTLPIVAGDITVYNAVNGGDPTISLGSSSSERLEIKAQYESGAQGLDGAIFTTYTAGSSTNDGRFTFFVDQVGTFQIRDHGINLYANKSLQINNTDIISDSGGTATLSNIDALDATTIATFETAMEANLDTFGSQMTSASALATVGTIGTGTWQGDVIANEYLDADTAHLTTDQEFTGIKTFANGIILDGDRSVTPRDGTAIHVDGMTITDTATSASGTANNNHTITIEAQTLAATNSSVTNTHAASLFIGNAPTAGTNMTLTNAYAIYAPLGLVKFGGALTVGGTITGDVTGDLTGDASGSSGSCTGQAATVATIAGLAPNTATTQATQGNITTLAGLTTIGQTGITTLISSNDVNFFNPVNNGNPMFKIGSSEDDRLEIAAIYNSGAQTLDQVLFRTETESSTADDGKFVFTVDELTTLQIDDGGIDFSANHGISINGDDIITDSSGTATLSNIDALDATTEATIETAIDTLSNLTSIGTIGTGVWQGTAIASAYLDADTAHLSGAQTFTGTKTLNSFKGTAGATVTNILDEDAMGSNSATALATQQSIKAYVDVNKITHYQVQGYATGGTGGDYVISKNIGSNLAPFLHNVSTGSDGLDAKSVTVWMRTGGHVMPNDCTLTRFTGWTASQGGASQTIALFRVRLADDSDTDPSAVLLQEITYTASGNQTADLFNETAASGSRDAALLDMEAGDIIFPAIKGAGNPIYFNGTFEVIPR